MRAPADGRNERPIPLVFRAVRALLDLLVGRPTRIRVAATRERMCELLRSDGWTVVNDPVEMVVDSSCLTGRLKGTNDGAELTLRRRGVGILNTTLAIAFAVLPPLFVGLGVADPDVPTWLWALLVSPLACFCLFWPLATWNASRELKDLRLRLAPEHRGPYRG